MSASLQGRLASRLAEARSGPGFGPAPGVEAEAEPTAWAALALDDDDARVWLLDHQRSDGGFGFVIGPVDSDAPTSAGALALPAGDARERALDHLVEARADRYPPFPLAPHDPDARGWAWTRGAFGWVEPTARALLALRLHRPSAAEEIADGLAVIADRECEGGGWNYGNAVVYDVPLPPYAQTTALALIGIQGELTAAAERGRAALHGLWRAEPGGLSLAVSLAALRLAGDADADAAEVELGRRFDGGDLDEDVIALAWGAIATGPGLESLRWPPT